ncbi:GntR family transcriptional regulator [Alsobacter metallidurans]|uniref:GntR family transcriptional regulator n=1 Tax=Alsobacter metallidurans TaxID=340221 RepID=A0A917MI10_9HYPH|nr:GntR family transcriptional regulator [Alsobacter metallidurans]
MSGKALLFRPGHEPASASEIYATVRRDIIRLRLRPGEQLSEKDLGLRFMTSRTPVREAIVRLVDDGLIHVLPQRGTFVTRISLRAVKRARFVRNALELAIIREAAEQGISDQTVSVLEAAIAAQEEAAGDAERFTDADDAFHRTIANALGLGDLWSVVENQKAQFDRIRFLSLPNVTPVALLVAQHRAILAAVLARDPAQAESMLAEHLSIVLDTAQGLLSTHPDLMLDDL